MFKKSFLKIVIAAGIVIFLTGLTFILPNVNSNKGKTQYLLIRKNTKFEEIIDSLKQKSSFISTLTFSIDAKLIGYPHKIKVGRYELKPGMSNIRLLNNLIKGRQKPVNLTFNNIRTKEQLCARLSGQLMVDSTTLYKLLSDSSMLQSYGLTENTVISIFIPNTYEVYWNISPKKLMKKIHTEYLHFWDSSRLAKAQKLNLKPYQISTLASIVEEESNMKSEKPMIAGLYLNRLHADMPLQADPTIKFALKDFSIKRVLFKHIQDSKNSPYNTYINKGLPPGPIRVPSVESMDAVLNYKVHPYFFMCAKGSGGKGHDFARTFKEHLQNAARYRNEMDKLGIK